MNFLEPEIKLNQEKFDKILSLIKENDKIIVFRHIMPDFDALGCQFGLATWLKDNFPEKEIKTVGDNHVTFTNRLFPEVDKVNDNYLNSDFLAFILDVGDKKRIADPRFEKAKYVVKIDHHPCVDKVAELEINQLEKASAAEIVANMLLYFRNFGYKLTKEAAKYLYIGMVGDSGRFLYNSVSPFSFSVAAEIVNTGIEITKIYENMYQKNIKDLEILKFIMNNYKISEQGVCYYILKQEDLERFNLTCERGKENVNFFSNFEGINIWCSITEDITEPCYRISIRSRNYRIDLAANKFKGGGHEQAAGCQITDLSELDEFIKELDLVVKNNVRS